MQNAPDARVTKDTEPVIVTFPEMKARKLSMAESIVEVYSLDPKIDVGLSLWVGVIVRIVTQCSCYEQNYALQA